jgi:hypothetical protein
LVEAVTPLPIGVAATGQTLVDIGGTRFYKDDVAQAWLLSLDGNWFRCDAAGRHLLWISNVAQKIASGMSGSPILADGKAIGVVCSSDAAGGTSGLPCGPEPALLQCLPHWLATEVLG